MDFKAFWEWLKRAFSGSPVPTPPPPAPFPPPVVPPVVVPPPTPPVVDPPPITPPPPVITPPPVVVPPVVTPPPAFRYPAQVVGPKWKVTLEDGSEVKPPQLATYSDSNFRVSSDGLGAAMRCHYDSGHTANSANPRCEWRELTSDGKGNASWSARSGKHKMRHELVVNRLMDIRPITVIGQIHDSANDVTVFRLEGSTLYLTDGNSTHTFKVMSDFRLDARHSVAFSVESGVISYLLDDKLIPFTLKCSSSGLYFKAGNYAQANPKSAPGGKSSDYAEVTTYGLTVSHS